MNIKKNVSAKRIIIFLSIIILFLLLILLYPLVFKSDFERYEEKYKYSKGLPYQVYKFLYLVGNVFQSSSVKISLILIDFRLLLIK